MHPGLRRNIIVGIVGGAAFLGLTWMLFRREEHREVRLLSASAPAAPAFPQSRVLRLMTYNIRHGERDDGRVDLGGVAEAIRGTGADIVALQEVDRYQARSGFIDQAGWLADTLGLQSVFGPTMRRGFGNYGNLLLTGFPVVRWRTLNLPGELEPRGAIVARLDVHGREVTVVVTHLGLSQADRMAQAAVLAEELRSEEGPIILMGDCNADVGDLEIGPLVQAGFRDVLIGKGVENRYTLRPRGGEPFAAIDHIFVSPDFAILGADVRDDRVSDHQPVAAEVVLSSPG